ncbi:hypothetical protein Hanom_Chr03g00198661 [Helianthus anomalus]
MMFSFLELKEVRKACDMLKEKEDVEGKLKLEDEKNDGMNNCTLFVRYVVQGLIQCHGSLEVIQFS